MSVGLYVASPGDVILGRPDGRQDGIHMGDIQITTVHLLSFPVVFSDT
jgi:hypothetical protein